MPLLSRQGEDDPESTERILRRVLEREQPAARSLSAAIKREGWFESCANPQCRAGWLQVWRSRTAPIFESGWSCSEACTEARIRHAVARENKGRAEAEPAHRHRIPLGLLMLEKNWISFKQLRGALESQRKHGSGRLGSWLAKQEGVSEELVTRAVALQWSCPVLSTDTHHLAQVAPLVPRLFVDAFGALPLRTVAGRVLYMGFEDRLNPVLALAIERMTGVRVECGVVEDSAFGQAHRRMLRATFPSVELVEAVNEAALVRVLTRAIEKVKPVQAKLVRVHAFLWLRMSRKAETWSAPEPGDVQDMICTIGGQ